MGPASLSRTTSWNDTATKTRNKVIGLTGGSLTVAVVLLVVPSQFLVAVAAVALCLGLWYIITRPALGAGFMVIVSAGFNAVTRDLDPVTLLVQYVALTVAAVVVGVLLGFTVIPASARLPCASGSRGPWMPRSPPSSRHDARGRDHPHPR